MSYKSLQQLRDEQQAHHDRAMILYKEAAIILQEMEYANNLTDYNTLHKQWLEKEAEAREEIQKSIKLTEQFIQELERLKNRNLN